MCIPAVAARSHAGHIELTASVCTGSLVLASAGVLRNRPATTHHGAPGRLAAIDATIDVRPDDREVRRFLQYDPATPV